jgi:hypothetical protein
MLFLNFLSPLYLALGKFFDISVAYFCQIQLGSCKDSPFFPKETTKSWNKCVATELQDPIRIQIRIFKDPDKFTIVFQTKIEPGNR